MPLGYRFSESGRSRKCGINQIRNCVVVVDQIALGDAFAGKQHFVEIGEFEAMAVHGDEHLGGRLGGGISGSRLINAARWFPEQRLLFFRLG